MTTITTPVKNYFYGCKTHRIKIMHFLAVFNRSKCLHRILFLGGRQRLLQKCIFSPKIRVHGSTFWRKIYFNINKSNKSTMALTTTVIKNTFTKVQNWKEENYQFSAVFNCPKLFQCIFFKEQPLTTSKNTPWAKNKVTYGCMLV